MDGNRIESFPPIADARSRALVLGTMPGAESLRQQRYYAYERNHFWAVIYALHGMEPAKEYEERVRFLQDKRIALWDVLAFCERRTSADGDIRNPVANDIPGLLETYPGIKKVFLNGNGAAGYYRRLVLPRMRRAVPSEALPSTSPAYTKPLQHKLSGWKPLLEFLACTE